MMRSAEITEWIGATPWADWRRSPLTGDASARSYERLHHSDGRTAILMNAPPDICGSQATFVTIAQHLRRTDISAPEVYKWDDALGVMILEDLGEVDFARHLAIFPAEEMTLYTAAAQTLDQVQRSGALVGLNTLSPDVGADMISLAFEWIGQDVDTNLRQAISAELRRLLVEIDHTEKVLSLRDFHAENLIWRPEQADHARVGLLDFQDAFLAHPAYDLASLLRDARRDVDPAITEPLITTFAKLRGLDPDETRRAFHILAVQRNLRIIGIFERLEKRDGKKGYRALMPRVFGHLQTDLGSPDLEKLQPLMKSAFPMIWENAG